VWGALPHNPVLAERFTHLTTREADRLTAGQARIACATALLRWLYAVVTKRQMWDRQVARGLGPARAAGGELPMAA
jgi:hypothetical protein